MCFKKFDWYHIQKYLNLPNPNLTVGQYYPDVMFQNEISRLIEKFNLLII